MPDQKTPPKKSYTNLSKSEKERDFQEVLRLANNEQAELVEKYDRNLEGKDSINIRMD